jgi:hypothetical protein
MRHTFALIAVLSLLLLPMLAVAQQEGVQDADVEPAEVEEVHDFETGDDINGVRRGPDAVEVRSFDHSGPGDLIKVRQNFVTQLVHSVDEL